MVKKFREILNKTEQTTGDDKHLDLLSALKLKRLNCLGETELASGKTLKSREIFRKAAFLAECVECSIIVWIIDHNCFHKLANVDTDKLCLSRHSSKFTIFVT